MCHAEPPNASLARSKSGAPPDCVINLIFCFYCQLHNVQQLIRPGQQMQTNLNPHYGDNQSGSRRVDSGTSLSNGSASAGAHLYHCRSPAEALCGTLLRGSGVTHDLYGRTCVNIRKCTDAKRPFQTEVRILVHYKQEELPTTIRHNNKTSFVSDF